MYQQELLYGYNSFIITAVLFVPIILFNEIGFQVGRFVQNRTDSGR